MKINLKKQMLLVLLGLNNSAQAQESPHDPLNTQVDSTGAVAMGRPRRLPCQHPPRQNGRKLVDWIRPDQCCGPDKPYHTSQKTCCTNDEGTIFHLINIKEKPDHKCCNGVVYDSTKMNCCQDKVVPYGSDLCTRCQLTEWSDWSECNEWSASVRERELVPNFGYEMGDCPPASEFNDTIAGSALGDIGVEMREDYGFWVDERSMDSEGIPCTGEMGARFLDRIIGVRDPEHPEANRQEFRDLLILVDESTSIGANNFEIVKRTLALMVANICGGVGLHKNRVALMRFSSEVKPDLSFDEGITMNKVLNKIEGLQYKTIINKNQHGSTYTANAMDHALNTVFKTENGWRNGVHPEGDHVRTEVIIITDGESNDPDNTFTIEGQKIKYDEAGIKVYALGVGDIKKREIETLTSNNSESIFYLLSWKHLAGFNYMVETLMSHEVYAEEGRCIPFTLDPTHKKKAIALHDQEYTQQVGTTVAEIVEAAKQRVQQERANAIQLRRNENKRRKLEEKLEKKQEKEMAKAQAANAAFVQEFEDEDDYVDLEQMPWAARGRRVQTEASRDSFRNPRLNLDDVQ